jgi:hypothetical protein
MTRLAIAVGLGALLGWLGSLVLALGSWTLIPWAVGALVIGFGIRVGRATLVGGCYGFTLAFVFMVAGYSGAAPLASRLMGFALLGVVGAACGAVVASVAAFIAARKRQS